MSGSGKPDPCRRFSDTTYAVPFGIYASGEAEPPANEVLVGREGRRAYLIDLLINTGRRGAFLVTGRRGAGKTTFVNQCLAEYEASVYKRFLNSHVGRGLLDRTGLMVMWLLLLCGGVHTLSELMQAFGAIADGAPGDQQSILAWVAMVPFGLLCLYPIYYARELVQFIIADCTRHRRGEPDPPSDLGESGFYASTAIVVVSIAFWYLGPFGSPLLGASRLFAVIGGLWFVAELISYKRHPGDVVARVRRIAARVRRIAGRLSRLCARVPSDSRFQRPAAGLRRLAAGARGTAMRAWRHRGVKQVDEALKVDPAEAPQVWRNLDRARRLTAQVWRYAGYGLWLVLVLLAAAYVAAGSSPWRHLMPADLRPVRVEYWLNIAGGLWLLTLGHLLRSAYHNTWRVDDMRDSPGSVMQSSARWYQRAAGFHMVLIALIAASHRPLLDALNLHYPRILPTLGTVTVVFLLLGWSGPPWRVDPLAARRTFRPLPRELLGLKALFVIAVSLQLCQPMLGRIPKAWESAVAAPSAEVRALCAGETPAARVQAQGLSFLREVSLDRCAVARPADQAGDSPLPSRDELLWLAALFLSVIILYFMEYEWIVRPSTLAREDRSLHRGQPPHWMEADDSRTSVGPDRHRRSAELTLPWVVFKTWLPVLVVKVNLGFDKLDHRRIVQAMLAGLRDHYRQSFLTWSSGLANLGRFLGLLFVIGLAYLTAEAWFDPAKSKAFDSCPKAGETAQGLPAADRLICAWESDALRATLYFNVLPIAVEAKGGANGEASPAWLQCRVYHVVLLLVFFLIGRWLFRRLPVLPYAQNLKRIDDLLESLSARTTWTSKKGMWKPAMWIYGFFSNDGDVRQTQMDPVDPRAVELAFLSILEDIQLGAVQLPGAALDQLSIPVPQLTFVFDELDKLGSTVGDAASSPVAMSNAERQRAFALHTLMSDLKNIISSAPARFIFVGGRNLHDEWLADRTARQPLLTNVFNAEIYLPSLMLDHYRDRLQTLDYWINQYLRRQHQRARELYSRWARRQWRPPMSLSVGAPQPERFGGAIDSGHQRGRLEPPGWQVWDCAGRGSSLESGEREIFLRNFIFFLTYRSKGNPKRLRDLLATFVRPVGRVLHNHELRWRDFPCKHVLQFNDDAVFRIQLLVDLYRHVAVVFEAQLLNRDDKLAISVFHMVDFLIRFHRRAFSWRNLERADVLAHIHRAPDLRLVVEELVEHCSERFLHRVVNGMYAFRFRSDLAREVEYISRQSADEMAAFNFTLDESQSLKALYTETLKSMDEGDVVHELVAGLGELYELDQEYEIARHHYRRALRIVDTDLKTAMGNPQTTDADDFRPVLEILEEQQAGSRYARFSTTWGIVRLRLMLQIGMTFELTRDLKRALAEYAGARTLAAALLKHHLGLITEGDGSAFGGGAHAEDRLHEIKQLNIFFLPAFAEAWAFEKLPGTLDTGHALVEEELRRLRTSLPFVNEPTVSPANDPTHMQHSNFALVMSQLHVRAGDLYFFKGRQAITVSEISNQAVELNEEHEGYLLQAHYHYAVGLHDLRNALEERQLSSAAKLSIFDPPNRTIGRGKWPDVFSRAIGNCLASIAEATLARISFLVLVGRDAKPSRFIGPNAPAPQELRERFDDLCDHWLEGNGSWMTWKEKLRREASECDRENAGEDRPPPESDGEAIAGLASSGRSILSSTLALVDQKTESGFEPDDLDHWFGELLGSGEDRGSSRLVRFGGAEEPSDRLMVALHLSLTGARYKEHGGYLEDAAREYLHVCEIVCHYLWWESGLWTIQEWQQEEPRRILGARSPVPGGFPVKVSDHLLALACRTLHEADRLFRQSRRDDHDRDLKYLVGDVIPPFALTLLCSLGLVSFAGHPQREGERGSLEKLLGEWIGKIPESASFPDQLREVLRDSIRRHAYPMINRLHAIKVLIDDAVLFDGAKDGDAPDLSLEWALELLKLKSGFKAPFHFTPLYSGVTFAQLWLKAQRPGEPTRPAHELLQLRRAAQRDLKTSEEMYTMRRAFYLAVSELYYLYDDFNDRQIHFNHAIQMAGTEWAAILAELVRDKASGIT